MDDIVDSAGTLCNAAVALMEAGAKSVSAYVTHGVLSGGAVARVSASPIESLVTTDSIMATEAVRVSQTVRQLTIAPLIAEAISRIAWSARFRVCSTDSAGPPLTDGILGRGTAPLEAARSEREKEKPMSDVLNCETTELRRRPRRERGRSARLARWSRPRGDLRRKAAGNPDLSRAARIDRAAAQEGLSRDLFEIACDGAEQRVLPRDVQFDPVTDVPIHVDFMRVGHTRVHVDVPVVFLNERVAGPEARRRAQRGAP